jgi:amino acid permease
MYDKEFFFGTSLLVGTIVGVGLFSLPYVAITTSFWLVVGYFVIISIMLVLLHHFYAEIGLQSPHPHHLPGFAGKYIGPFAKKITLIAESVGLFGAQLAYLIVGGNFLAQLFHQGGTQFETAFALIFFSAAGILIWRGIKSVAETEFILLLMLIIFVISFFGFSFIEGSYSPTTMGMNTDPLLPYGVIIFSLWGLSAIPELNIMFKRKEKKINRMIITGISLSVLIYLLFIWSVLSISGPDTSLESLSGLQALIPSGLYRFALLFGLLTTFTSFLGIGIALKRTYFDDYNLRMSTSWLIAMGVPLILYLTGFDNFLEIIGISGSIGFTISAIMVYIIYIKLKPKNGKVIHHKLFTHKSFVFILLFLTVLGALLSIATRYL